MGHPFSGGMSPVRRAKSVIYVDVCQRRELFRHYRIVFRFTIMEAGVFQQQYLARFQLGGIPLGNWTYAVFGEDDRFLQYFTQVLGYRAQRKLRFYTALGSPEMRCQGQTGPMIE